MAIFKCKMCGGALDIRPGVSVVECEYCGTKQTVPAADDEKKLTLFSRANRLRFGCEFDKAAGVYETIVADFPEEAEAYWGLVLCKYGIEYVDDPATGKKIPTCHRSSFDSVMKDTNFEQACENADEYARRVYRDEAKVFEELRRSIISVSQNEQPYDIFISYKEKDSKGERTVDSVIAQDVYDALTDKGYRVFFSRISLEDKLGTEYEPYIFAALHSAKLMLVFGTDYENFNAVWVKNEWSRYLQLMTSDKTKHLIPCFKGIDAYDMPEEFNKLAAQDMGKVGAMQDLLRGVEKILPKNGKAEQAAPVASPVAPAAPAAPAAPGVESYLQRAFIYLEDGDWQNADNYCERVLDIAPKNAQAYLAKLMIELKCRTEDELKNQPQPFDDRAFYAKAVRFGDEAFRKKLEDDNEFIRQRIKTRTLQAAYDKALGMMNSAMSEEAYVSAAEEFRKISGFKDADEKTKECLDKAEATRKDAVYASAEAVIKAGKTEEACKKAAEIFDTISGWRDADKRAAECRELAETTRKERIYDLAVKQQRANRLSSLKTAADNFAEIKGWRDADERAMDCLRRIEEIQKAKEHSRQKPGKPMVIAAAAVCVAVVLLAIKVFIPISNYNKAMALYAAKDYEAAIAAFEAMDGYKDSAAQIELCKTGIKDRAYDEAVALYKSGEYHAAIAAFEAMDGYRDSAERIRSYYADPMKSANKGDVITFGKYEQDNDTANGKERIEWIVLDKQDGKLLLISKFGLDTIPYNEEFENVTWQTCTLRKWMNEEFVNSAFSAEEQKLIATTMVRADKNPNYDTNPDSDTEDKIFLLSIDEANKYFSSYSARQTSPTKYAKAQGALTNEKYKTASGEAACWWWLRSPGFYQNTAAGVHLGGSFSYGGGVRNDNAAVRPAMWVSVE